MDELLEDGVHGRVVPLGAWEQAAEYYLAAAGEAPQGSDAQALALYNLTVALSYTDNRGAFERALQLYENTCAQSPAARCASRRTTSA